MAGFDATEIIKYLFGSLVTLGGGYVLFVIKSIGKDIENVSKDINQLKELLMTQILDVKEDINKHTTDINQLYDLHRENEKDKGLTAKEIAEIKATLLALKDEHNRRACEVK
jgi:septal ring factor EnvC (AmiA/AmiB activator)